MNMEIEVKLLGPLEVATPGGSVEFEGAKQRRLFVALALKAPDSVSVDELVEAVWDDRPPDGRDAALQKQVSRLRARLGEALPVRRKAAGYALEIDRDAIDSHRFEAQLDAARGDAARLATALELWRGPALADHRFDNFAQSEVTRLDELRLEAIEERFQAELARGQAVDLVGDLRALVAEHPLRERLRGQLMLALYRAGRQADALEQMREGRRRLVEELGLEPGPELRKLEAMILAHDPELDAASQTDVLAAPLPAPSNTTIGREGELAEITALLAKPEVRLLTLVGAGGVGKTRLALEAGRALNSRFSGGLAFIDLTSAEGALVPAAANALGVIAETPHELGERLARATHGASALLVLDGFERLLNAAAQVAQLLAAVPNLTVLATSRAPLRLTAEQAYVVQPLAVSNAAALFTARVRASRPDWTPDPEVVAAICARLDGLPLAIELAAARLRTMSVQQLAERLDDRFRLLTGGSRAALPRHRTLRAVVDWSWGLLDEEERTLARRLAVFQAGATEESAAAVCDVPDVLDGLTALAERSLIVPGERYRMLETIREYGLEKLAEAGEVEAIRGAHARWHSELVDRAEPELRRADQGIWFHRLQEEKDDILAALRWYGDTGDTRSAMHLAVRLLWFWMLSGAPDEAMNWIAFAAKSGGEVDPIDRLISDGILIIRKATQSGAPDDAELQRVGERLEEVDTNLHPWLALTRPIFALVAGDMDLAERRLAEAFEHPDPWVRATALLMRGHVAENHGDQLHMRADLEGAVAAYREIGDSWALAMALSSLAGTLSVIDDLDAAEVALDEATELLASLNGTAGSGMLRMRLSDIRTRRGDVAGARVLSKEALTDSDLDRDAAVVGNATVARLAWLDGDLDEMRRYTAEAQRRLDRLGPLRPEQGHAEALVQSLQAIVALEDGDCARARELAGAATLTAAGTRDMPIVGFTGVIAATISLREGDVEAAATQLGAAAVLRGAEDLSNPEVGRLEAALRHPAYERARALSQDEALALLGAPVVGAQRERHEDHQ